MSMCREGDFSITVSLVVTASGFSRAMNFEFASVGWLKYSSKMKDPPLLISMQ